jgi:hypothetical protein
VVYGLAGPDLLLAWIKDDDFQWYTPQSAEIADAVLRIDALADGRWCGRWYDPWQGSHGAAVSATTVAGALELPIPPFARDFALRLRRCTS